jgi:hypothetical protein
MDEYKHKDKYYCMKCPVATGRGDGGDGDDEIEEGDDDDVFF